MTDHFMEMALEVNTFKSIMYLDKWSIKFLAKCFKAFCVHKMKMQKIQVI